MATALVAPERDSVKFASAKVCTGTRGACRDARRGASQARYDEAASQLAAEAARLQRKQERAADRRLRRVHHDVSRCPWRLSAVPL